MNLRDFAERFTKKGKSNSVGGKEFVREIFSRLFIPSAVIWIATITLCILLGNIAVSDLLVAVASGFFFCLFIYFWLVWMGAMFVCTPVGENIAEIDIYESTIRERTKLLKQVLNLPTTFAIINFMIY